MINGATIRAACNAIKDLSNKQLGNQILSKVENLEKKMDTVLIRDLMAANAALDDIKAVGRGTPDQIAQIRKLYMSNTGLPLGQQTYEIDNSKIILASYLGLLQIGIKQKEDEKMLCRYMLHMVATGEEIVHTKMLESFCINCFADIRDEVVSKYEHRKLNWQEENELVRLYQSREVAVDAMKRPVGFFILAVGIYNAAKNIKIQRRAGNVRNLFVIF